MRILVLGGTGAMGVHLVKFLAENGNKIFVTSRRARQSGQNIIYLQGDAHADDFLEKLLESPWDIIIDFMVYSSKEFQNRAEKLLKAAGQYIFLSSARVYADSSSPITEESPRLLDCCRDEAYLETDEYALSKARQENVLIDGNRRNWTIIRPYITFSENRLQLGVLEKEHWLYRALHGRTSVFSHDIASNLTTLTYGYDVARGIAGVAGQAKALGEVFHITHNEAHSWNEILSVYLDVLEKHLGIRPPILLTDKALNLRYGKYQVIYDRYFNRRFDNSKIGAFMDLSSLKPPLLGLKECLESFLKKPQFGLIFSSWEATADKLVKEHTSLWELPNWKQRVKYLVYRYIQ